MIVKRIFHALFWDGQLIGMTDKRLITSSPFKTSYTVTGYVGVIERIPVHFIHLWRSHTEPSYKLFMK